MDRAGIPVLSLADEPERFSKAIGDSMRRFGFAMVKDHGIDDALIARSWELTETFFALPEEEKRAYFVSGIAGARGYTPFRTEVAKGAREPDRKEFWHIGRDLPPGHPLADTMPPNIWPERPAGFRETFEILFAEFDRVGATIMARLAQHLGLPVSWFDNAIEDGNSVLRLLHYPPFEGHEAGVRAEAHEDINLITLLLGAEEAGLELLSRDGAWLRVTPPPGALVVNIGDMLQRLTNHVLPSTTHRVRNPAVGRRNHSRYSMPFFLHLRSDFPLATLSQCIDDSHPDLYPEVITADEFLQQRLVEIGLKH